MKELRVEVLAVMEHAPDRVEEAAHDGDEGDIFLSVLASASPLGPPPLTCSTLCGYCCLKVRNIWVHCDTLLMR